MGYFAKLDENNYVIEIHSVMNKDFTINGIEDESIGINFLNTILNINATWKQTSYNTRGGIHYTNQLLSLDQTKAFRKNCASIGYYYDNVKDAFIPPKPYPSWILDEFSCLWNPPIPYPDTSNIPEPYIWYNRYFWNEDTINWQLQKPFNSWSLNQDNYYISPVLYPSDGNKYYWNEDILNWELII